jgi:hypothetical protein
MIRALLLRLSEYLRNPDPLANAAGTIAIVVAGNQPFYPLYLHAIVGTLAWPAWLTLLSTPFFLAVPAVARRNSLVGRALLPIAGVANTVLCVKLFGVDTAVELFLLPCVLLAALLFRPCERAVMVLVLAVPFVAYLGLDWNLEPPLQVFSEKEYRSIVAIHGMSVAALTILIGLQFNAILPKGQLRM